MPEPTRFSCFLIGGDTLLAQCADVLLEKGHDVLGIITDADRIREWAEGNKVPVIPASGDYVRILQKTDHDYLFAITHLRLIPDAAAESPRRLAINFHDGPLPSYAGLNAPMWAIMSGETDYGISWHVMSSGIDKGDILLRQPLEISNDDTGLSLNTKCFAAAIESFPRLVDDLAEGVATTEPQALNQRSYFSAAKKPDAAGVLDWKQPAISLERLVRALSVGRYPNPLASPKLLLEAGAFIVETASASEDESKAKPGEIVDIGPDSFAVQTSDGVLSISSLATLNGQETPIASIVAEAGLKVGQKLPDLTEAETAEIERIAHDTAQREAGIVEQLRDIEPVELPYREQISSDSADRRESVKVSVPDSFLDSIEKELFVQSLQAAFALFLSRILGQHRLQIPIAKKPSHAGSRYITNLIVDHSYVDISIDDDEPAREQLRTIGENLRAEAESESFLRDLVARQPELQTNEQLRSDRSLSILLSQDEHAADHSEIAASIVFCASADGTASLEYSPYDYSPDAISRLRDHFTTVLNQLGSSEDITVASIDLLSESEKSLVIDEWNDTAAEYEPELLLHQAFERQAKRTPTAIAIASGSEEITYRDLDLRANTLASQLRQLDIGPDVLVGVHISRSIELMVATLGVLKAGGAYVPLDPAFPSDRIEFMISDSEMPLIITEGRIRNQLPQSDAAVMEIDSIGKETDKAEDFCGPQMDAANLAYVIYTSGSTGRPKGVAIEHRNVNNFFVAMDGVVPRNADRPETWLAVTSLSFDISVLELFWTLTRGLKVVIYSQTHAGPTAQTQPEMRRALGLGLFMWGNDDAPGRAKYRLLMEGSKFFDDNRFAAVWTPERHFHAFGGPYPNPAVTGAAVAAITSHVKIRAGSCVVPLHHPVRIAEEWAVVDNLSNGRAEIAAASGWNPNDFLLRPENHAKNKEIMFTQLEEVRRLWRGETLSFPGPLGKDVEIQSLPRPVQSELPCWITTAGNPETWRDAGRRGFNVLTHLLGQTVAEVGEKIRLYREARAEAGFDPESGRVALMLHTFVGEDDDSVREIVREPMKSYLASSMRLAMNFAWSFPAFKRPGGADTKPEDIDINSLTEEEVDTILDFAFERYFSTSGLFGSLDTCLRMLKSCSEINVDEIACLLDFGIETDAVMKSLPKLKQLNDMVHESLAANQNNRPVEKIDQSFAGLVRDQAVTHLQCTPSMARMFSSDSESRSALAKIPHLLLGGEALPEALASELLDLRDGTLTNMYGPTETTIWSMTHRVESAEDGIPIGRPIANTRVYVLDDLKRPVPIGMTGQLYIGGDGVARGYLGRHELTSERFVPDPFHKKVGARMYATGDLVKYGPDGLMDFIGRADFQVKVRGFRIELGEIESVLENQGSIHEAAVVVRAEDAADQRLVAYVVCQPDSKFDQADLKAALNEKLPEYMIPNEFIDIPDMPRTANGKLDRIALQSIRKTVPRDTEQAPPASDTEKTIADLWKETLKLEAVSIDENFFDLGGHSLLIVQLHSKLKEKISVPISLTDLYQYPTIRTLSDHLSAGDGGEALQKSVSRGARRRALRSRSA